MCETRYNWVLLFAFIFVFGVLLVSTPAHAQQVINLDLTLSPSNPRPGQQVTVTVSSFSTDINRAVVSWYKNNALAESGLGNNSYSFTLGKIGSTETIRVVAQTAQGLTAEKILTLNPADILLIWQADSYTPPFYRGKALHTAEGDFVVLAIPNIVVNGSLIPSNSLIFTWERDGVVLGSLSGIGRDTLNVDGSVLSRPINITVTVETQSGSVKPRRNTRIPISQPVVYLYEHDPVLGILFNNTLLKRLRMEAEETTVESFPYFFSIRDRYGAPTYEWRVGTRLVENNNSPNLTLRRGESSGSTALSVSAKNPFSILEIANRNITVEFGL